MLLFRSIGLAVVLELSFAVNMFGQTCTPEADNNGVFSINIGEQVLKIDPKIGGRITALEFNGKNFFTGVEMHPLFWGSTFWPSPQSDWGNSSPAELDRFSYFSEIEGDTLVLESEVDKRFGLRFIKKISGDCQIKVFRLIYTILNESDSVRDVAPWEVSRVHISGLAFFPKKAGKTWGNLAHFTEDIDGVTWFLFNKEEIPPVHNKFYSDSDEGWIAQVNDDVIFIKQFPDISLGDAAPAESEVAVYTNPNKTYVEIEEQGKLKKLKPGESLTWEVLWYIRKIPAGIKIEPGSSSLVSLVRGYLPIRER